MPARAVPRLTAAALLEELGRLDLVEPPALEEVRRRCLFDKVDDLARHLNERGLLSSYQATELLQRRGDGLVLGQYVVIEPLGGGGMGQVFKARHRLMRRVVALKVIREEVMSKPDAVARFRREIELAAQLSHPNIITSHDAELIGSRHCLVMEYCAGETLFQLVRRAGRLSLPHAFTYVRQATLGLGHAHSKGLIHRDLKPENLLLTAGVVKILDFGLARLRQSENDKVLTRLGVVVGTPDYIAPEQINDSHAADIRSDIYSLGCSLYFLLAGQVPFPGGDAAEKLLRQQTEDPMPLEQLRTDLPKGARAVLVRMMAKTPADRYQTPDDLADALAQFALDASDTATDLSLPSTSLAQPRDTGFAPTYHAPAPKPQGAAQRALAVPSRRPVALWIGAAAGVVLLLILAIVFWPRDSAPALPASKSPLAKTSPSDVSITVPDEPVSWKYVLSHVMRIKDIPVFRLDVSPDGTMLALACADRNFLGKPGEVSIWSLAGKEPSRLLARPLDYGPTCVAFSPHNKRLAWSGATPEGSSPVTVLDLKSGKDIAVLHGHKRGATSVAFSKDGSFLVSGGYDGRIGIWDLPDGKKPFFLAASATALSGASLTPDGRTVICGGTDRIVRVWDIAAKKQHPALEKEILPWGAVYLAVSPDGKLGAAAYGTKDVKTGVALWDLATRRMRREVLQEDNPASVIVFTPDSQAIVTGGLDRCVHIWNVKTGKLETTLPEKHGSMIFGLGMSADGTVLASSDGSAVRIWHRDKK